MSTDPMSAIQAAEERAKTAREELATATKGAESLGLATLEQVRKRMATLRAAVEAADLEVTKLRASNEARRASLREELATLSRTLGPEALASAVTSGHGAGACRELVASARAFSACVAALIAQVDEQFEAYKRAASIAAELGVAHPPAPASYMHARMHALAALSRAGISPNMSSWLATIADEETLASRIGDALNIAVTTQLHAREGGTTTQERIRHMLAGTIDRHVDALRSPRDAQLRRDQERHEVEVQILSLEKHLRARQTMSQEEPPTADAAIAVDAETQLAKLRTRHRALGGDGLPQAPKETRRTYRAPEEQAKGMREKIHYQDPLTRDESDPLPAELLPGPALEADA
jgi:hypothetical protein